MPDESVKASTDPPVAVDVINEASYQRFKPTVGADGTAVDVSAANPMPTADSAGKGVLDSIKGLLEGTLKVGAALTSPVAVRLSDGSEAIGSTAKRLHVSDGGVALAAALAASTAEIGKVKVTELPAAVLAAGTNVIGSIKKIEEALPAGENLLGKVVINPGANLIGVVNLRPTTTGGLETTKVISAAGTNAGSAKTSNGQVYGWYFYNAGAATRYLKLYNKASAPTVGTDVPKMTLAIPPGAAANMEGPSGVAFSTGIAYALTKGMGDTNSEGVGAEEVLFNLLWK